MFFVTGNYLQRTKSLTEHSIPIHGEIEVFIFNITFSLDHRGLIM